ncbi:hypothetical protein [Georgenia sp. 311]|uniref:hypothetical protein n=1 Tax=Georgenia sp. 311 TaxID=2585134 RepID=UPI00350E349F
MLIDPQAHDPSEAGLIAGQLHQAGLDGAPQRLSVHPKLLGQSLHGGVLAARLSDRPLHGPGGQRPSWGDEVGDLLDERASRAVGVGQRQVRCRQITCTATMPGTSWSSRRRRPRATTPQVRQHINCQAVETVMVISPAVRSTLSTWRPGMPRSVSQRAQGSVEGASLHPVALVNVEVLNEQLLGRY